MKHALAVSAMVASMALLSGCAVALFGAAAGGGGAGEYYSRDSRAKPTAQDQAIMSTLRARYETDKLTADEYINVLSINGVVTLGGKLKDQAVINHVIDIARSTKGVKQVISNLQIRMEG